MQKKIFYILAIALFISCKNEQKRTRYTDEQISLLSLDSTKICDISTDSIKTIDLNPFLKKQAFDFGSLVKELRFIPLETTDKSLLDDIRKIVVTDTHIYIHDDFKDGGIVIFDNKGKFIKRIPNGKGPGELVRLYDIDFDRLNNQLIAYQHSFLLFYSPSGEFIRQKRLPFGFYNFAVTPQGYVFKVLEGGQGNGHLGALEKYTLLVTDKDFKIKSVGLPKSRYATSFGASQLLFDNATLDITHQYTDTIFQYNSTEKKLEANYFLDYSKKKLPNTYLFDTDEKFKNAIKNNDYYFFLGQYNHTYSHNVIYLDNWFENVRLVVYRDKQSGNSKGGTLANFDSNEIPSIAFPSWVSGEYFISLYFPNKKDLFLSNSTIVSDEDKSKIKNLSENSNPVLVFFKLKTF